MYRSLTAAELPMSPFDVATAMMSKCIDYALNAVFGLFILVASIVVACFDGYEKVGATGIIFSVLWSIVFLLYAFDMDRMIDRYLNYTCPNIDKNMVLQAALQKEYV